LASFAVSKSYSLLQPALCGSFYLWDMTLPQRSFINPETAMERNQEFDKSLECKSCIHHGYVWSVRVCTLHEGKAGNNLELCSDYQKSKRSAYDKLNEAFDKSRQESRDYADDD
jgi:hypothetical protein